MRVRSGVLFVGTRHEPAIGASEPRARKRRENRKIVGRVEPMGPKSRVGWGLNAELGATVGQVRAVLAPEAVWQVGFPKSLSVC